MLAIAVAAAFLVEIEQDAAAVPGHPLHGPAQLVAAIAFEAAEQIAGQAGRVEADRNRFRQIRPPDDDRHLVAQSSPPEHHELGLGRAVERDRRAKRP